MNKVGFMVSVREYLYTLSNHNQYDHFDFPPKINDWELAEEINRGRDFETAIYTKIGKKAFAKIWHGNKKDHRYYRLLNEYNLYIHLRNCSETNEQLVSVPEVILKDETEGSLIILVEFINGDKLLNRVHEEQIEVYEKVRTYLSYATEYIHTNYLDIAIRDGRTELFTFIPYLLNSLRWHPKKIFTMLFLGGYYILNLRVRFKTKASELVLSHRDLHLENILLSNNKIYLIDLEYMAITSKYADLSNTLRLESSRRPAFTNKLRAEVNIFNNKSFLMDLISTAFKWGVEDAFVVNKNNYTFLDFVNRSVKSSLLLDIRKVIYKPFKFSNKNGVVLCYHGIGGIDIYNVEIETFKNQVDVLLRKYKFISLEELVSGKNGISLTFDDGYTSIKSAIQFLEELGIPYALFIVGDKMKVDREYLGNEAELLSTHDIKMLSKSRLCTICAHSNTHTDLTKLDEEQLKEEVEGAKNKIESIIGRNVDYFAYPRGNYTPNVMDAVKKANYKAGFSVKPGYYNEELRYEAPRIVVNQTHTPSEMPAVLSKQVQAFKRFCLKTNLWRKINYEK